MTTPASVWPIVEELPRRPSFMEVKAAAHSGLARLMLELNDLAAAADHVTAAKSLHSRLAEADPLHVAWQDAMHADDSLLSRIDESRP